MASLSLRPPVPFNFRKPEEWKKWKSRFEQYRLASGLSKESAERQVSSLLYCMGEDAEAVLATTRISDKDRADYSKVLEKFDGHFKVRKNLIFERATINQARQLSDETADQFITRLHLLADNCEFENLRDEMIRDQLVIGIHDRRLSKRLQMETGLNLQQAETMVRQRAAVQEQQYALKHPADTKLQMESVRRSHTFANKQRKPSKRKHLLRHKVYLKVQKMW